MTLLNVLIFIVAAPLVLFLLMLLFAVFHAVHDENFLSELMQESERFSK
jgi:type IV secretory pathway VirB3-like protein